MGNDSDERLDRLRDVVFEIREAVGQDAIDEAFLRADRMIAELRGRRLPCDDRSEWASVSVRADGVDALVSVKESDGGARKAAEIAARACAERIGTKPIEHRCSIDIDGTPVTLSVPVRCGSHRARELAELLGAAVQAQKLVALFGHKLHGKAR